MCICPLSLSLSHSLWTLETNILFKPSAVGTHPQPHARPGTPVGMSRSSESGGFARELISTSCPLGHTNDKTIKNSSEAKAPDKLMGGGWRERQGRGAVNRTLVFCLETSKKEVIVCPSLMPAGTPLLS